MSNINTLLTGKICYINLLNKSKVISYTILIVTVYYMFIASYADKIAGTATTKRRQCTAKRNPIFQCAYALQSVYLHFLHIIN